MEYLSRTGMPTNLFKIVKHIRIVSEERSKQKQKKKKKNDNMNKKNGQTCVCVCVMMMMMTMMMDKVSFFELK